MTKIPMYDRHARNERVRYIVWEVLQYDERSSFSRSVLPHADDGSVIHVKGGVPYANRIRRRTRLVHRLPYRQEQLTRLQDLRR